MDGGSGVWWEPGISVQYPSGLRGDQKGQKPMWSESCWSSLVRERATAMAHVPWLRAVMIPHVDVEIRCLVLSSASPYLGYLNKKKCSGLQLLHQ